MKTNLTEKRHAKYMKPDDDSDILELYGCDDNPLSYMIEPKGSVRITSKDDKTTKEDLENIL